MADADLDATVRPWGNSLGIVIPAELVRSLKLVPGETVHVRLSYEPARNDASSLPRFDFLRDADIDAILDEELGR